MPWRGHEILARRFRRGITAVASISTLARSSISAVTSHRGHGRVVAADDFAEGRADLACRRPGIRACRSRTRSCARCARACRRPRAAPSTMFCSAWRAWPAKSSLWNTALRVPADHAGDEHHPAAARRRRWHSPSGAASLRAGLRMMVSHLSTGHACVPSFEQFARDDELLHFGRAFVDAQRADLAVQPLDRLLADHAQAAAHLHRRVDHLLRAFGGGQLGHRGFAGHVAGPGRAARRRGRSAARRCRWWSPSAPAWPA